MGPEQAERRLVLLHGWGADADDLLELGLELVDGEEGVDVVALRAPGLHPAGAGRQWYPLAPAPDWAALPAARHGLRERLEQHRDNPDCAGCHNFIDPPGYLFERFDSVGRYREEVGGLPVDSTGELNGVAMEDATGLGEVLMEDERLAACMVKQLYRHASARLDKPGEQAALEELEAEFERSGYRFNALLRALALSEGFRTVAMPRGGQP